MSHFQNLYTTKITSDLASKYNIRTSGNKDAKKEGMRNPHTMPKVLKITVSMGLSGLTTDAFEEAVKELSLITGQKPKHCATFRDSF